MTTASPPAEVRDEPTAHVAGPAAAWFEYIPSLDGLRALAVLAVLAFHGELARMQGGFLGVDAFFVLSGFLITSLLVAEHARRRTISLPGFWARRARRLLPALVLMLLAVAVWVRVVEPPGAFPGLRGDTLASLFYVANWHFAFGANDYFAQASLASPLTHTWSLAIEEQFYLVWPVVVLLVLRASRGRIAPLLSVAVAGALASAAAMAVLYDGTNASRLYYGTDTHAQCVLVGASLALVMAARARRQAGAAAPARTARVAGALAVVGLAVTVGLWFAVSGSSAFLYRGGFLVAAAAAALVIFGVVTTERGLVARFLSTRPLRYLGRISYGVYLWHYPLFVLVLTGQRTGLSGWPLFAVRAAATVAVATASYYLVEQPIRSGWWLRRGWHSAAGGAGAVVLAACALLVLVPAGIGGAPAAAAPTSPPPAPVAGGPAPTSVLVLGDSTAVTLGLDLQVSQASYRAQVHLAAILGCGVMVVPQILTHGSVDTMPPACTPSTPAAQQWPALWAASVAKVRPAVVLILIGRREVGDALYQGHWTNVLQAPFAGYLRSQLAAGVAIAGSTGAHVEVATAPCYQSGEAADGSPWPEDSPARLAALNGLIRQVARSSGASVIDLDRVVCPGGQFMSSADGVTIRDPDGVHFYYFKPGIVPAGQWLGRRLWPLILAGSARPGPGPSPG